MFSITSSTQVFSYFLLVSIAFFIHRSFHIHFYNFTFPSFSFFHPHLLSFSIFFLLLFSRFLSPVCLDFMKNLLVKDPSKRMSTGQALRHPFITGIVSSDIIFILLMLLLLSLLLSLLLLLLHAYSFICPRNGEIWYLSFLSFLIIWPLILSAISSLHLLIFSSLLCASIPKLNI